MKEYIFIYILLCKMQRVLKTIVNTDPVCSLLSVSVSLCLSVNEGIYIYIYIVM